MNESFRYDRHSIWSFSEQKKMFERRQQEEQKKLEKWRREAEIKNRRKEARHKDKSNFMKTAEAAALEAGYDKIEGFRVGSRAADVFESVYPQSEEAEYWYDPEKLDIALFDYKTLFKGQEGRKTMAKKVKTESAQISYDTVLQDALAKVDRANEIRDSYNAKCEKLRADKEALILGTIGYNQELADATAAANEEMESLKSTLDRHLETYSERMKEYASLSGDSLTSDLKLLDGSIPLSAEEVDQLLERYSDNYLMSRKIWDYWRNTRRPEIEAENQRWVGVSGRKAESTKLTHVLQSPDEKMKIFTNYVNTLKNCMGDVNRAGVTPDTFGDIKDFMKMMAGEYLQKNVPENEIPYDLTRYKVERTGAKPPTIF
jgi:hypothetical protein